jgi:hypothetical protein
MNKSDITGETNSYQFEGGGIQRTMTKAPGDLQSFLKLGSKTNSESREPQAIDFLALNKQQ